MEPEPHDAQTDRDVSDSVPFEVHDRRHGDAVGHRLARVYGHALQVGDPQAAATAIVKALGEGLTPVEVQSRVIAPAMHEIGELWESGSVTVAQEHLATTLSHHVLSRLYSGMLGGTQRHGGSVVVAGVPGEHHLLGLRMAADVFEGAGFDVRFLGTDVPHDSLLAWVADHDPAIVALGATMPLDGASLLQQLQALQGLDPALQLVIGGQGVPIALRQTTGVFYAATTEQLAEYTSHPQNGRPQGALPREIAPGGIGFEPVINRSPLLSDGLEARFDQTILAMADTARGETRRAVALELIAFRDPLTKLWNRRAFDDRYETLLEDAISPPPTLLIIDVDRFKSVNDGFGHDAGDRALVGVARCITQSIRESDFVARIGGDEFVVMLPNAAAELAAKVGDRIRARIELDLTDPQITVSIGISVPDHTDRRRATIEADQALYKAKALGRNQLAFT